MFSPVFFQTITSVYKQPKMVFVLLYLVVAKYISSTFLGLRRPDDWYWFATLHCFTNVLERILCNTELLYIGLRHSATKKERLFVLFLNYSASLRSSFWGTVFFPRWLHLKHLCWEYRFQYPDDRQQQFGAEGHQHDGDDGGDGDSDGDDVMLTDTNMVMMMMIVQLKVEFDWCSWGI